MINNIIVKPQLTKREIEILELKAQGFTNQEIADKLFISIKTAEQHWNKILCILDCKNNSQKAIYESYKYGIIRPPVDNEVLEALSDLVKSSKIIKHSCEILSNFNFNITSIKGLINEL